MSDFASKLTSRKFWVALAAALTSIGTAIGGLATSNETVAVAGVVCLIVSQAIYSFCEAYVDGASISANATTTTITASTASAISAVKDASATAAATTSSSKKEDANNG